MINIRKEIIYQFEYRSEYSCLFYPALSCSTPQSKLITTHRFLLFEILATPET